MESGAASAAELTWESLPLGRARQSMALEEDRRDIRACLDGDASAYERIVIRYEPRVAGQMWRFARDPATQEELTQEVFVEVYFSLSRFRGDAPLLHWIRRIATRVGYRYWKRRDREPDLAPLTDAHGATADEDDLDPQWAAEVLHGLLGRLKPADRLVMTLMYLDGLAVKEIARRTGWTQAMVKMRAYRARKKLRKIAESETLLEELFDG